MILSFTLDEGISRAQSNVAAKSSEMFNRVVTMAEVPGWIQCPEEIPNRCRQHEHTVRAEHPSELAEHFYLASFLQVLDDLGEHHDVKTPGSEGQLVD